MKLLAMFLLLTPPFLCGMQFFREVVGDAEPTIQTIDDVPQFCTRIIEKLNQQPVVKGNWRPPINDQDLEDSHILNLNLVDSTIVEWVNTRASQNLPTADFLGKRGWNIFRYRDNFSIDVNGETTKGDGLWLSDKNKDSRYSIQELNEKYKSILAAVRTGWQFSRERGQSYDLNLPGAFERKDWHVLVKKEFLVNEDEFLRFLMAKVGIEHEMRCLTKYEWFDRRAKIDDEVHL